MATYQLSDNLEYWGDNVTQRVADRATWIGALVIETTFPDVTVTIVHGDQQNDLEDPVIATVEQFVRDTWVRWLEAADQEVR